MAHMEAMLDPSRVELCGDVYRALARLFSSGAEAPPVVIVCVDGLGVPELEFFSIVSRMGPNLDVYVYGHKRSRSRIKRAIELGASGEVTEELLRALAESCSAPAQTGDQPDSVIRAAAPQIRTDPVPDVPGAGQPEVAPRPNKKAQGDDEENTSPVRVPWSRYADRPARTAPARRAPPSPEVLATQPARPEQTLSEPLLTDEELRALLGDDVAAIAPEEPPTPLPDEQQHGGASP